MNRPDPDAPEPAPRRTPLVSVVVVNYDAWPDVARLVEALSASPEVAEGLAEVVVVDNASEGPVPPALLAPGAGVRLVLRPDNGGFAVGVNAGWRAARGPWLLLLNPDVVADPGFLGRVAAKVRDLDRRGGDAPGVVGFGLRNPDGTRQPSVGAFPNVFRAAWEQVIPRARRKYQAAWRTRPGPVPWVTGACALVNGALLSDLGGLDEDFFLYYEEVALCRSAAGRGWRVEFDPGVEVVHMRPLQNRAVSPTIRVITRHSKLLYFRKHLPRWQFLTLGAVVAAEAKGRLAWSVARKRPEEARAWRAVARIEQALRRGGSLGGRDVLALADAVRVDPAERRPGGPRRTLGG